MNGLTGGCMCGDVRYILASAPFDCGWCHCRTCQLNSGSPAMVFASVPTGDLAWTKGAERVRSIASSSFGHRSFCGSCGTPLLMQLDQEPETIDFSVATLDDPRSLSPEFHIFWRSRVAWFNPGDDLPKYETFRPGRDGPTETEPLPV